MFHVARTICRRAERHLAALVQADKKAVSMEMLAYINRLSDLFFVLARLSNAQAGVADVPLEKILIAQQFIAQNANCLTIKCLLYRQYPADTQFFSDG